MTAVDYLEREFKDKLIGENIPEWVQDIFNKAKAMEKEQIIQACRYGNSFDQGDLICEVYYNETFKIKK